MRRTHLKLFFLVCLVAVLIQAGCKPPIQQGFARDFTIRNFCDYDIDYSIQFDEDLKNNDITSEAVTGILSLTGNYPTQMWLKDVKNRKIKSKSNDIFSSIAPTHIAMAHIGLKWTTNPPFTFSAKSQVVVRHNNDEKTVEVFDGRQLEKMQTHYGESGTFYSHEIAIEICSTNKKSYSKDISSPFTEPASNSR